VARQSFDAACVAYLLKSGADLGSSTTSFHPKIERTSNRVLQDLIKSSRVLSVHDAKVVLATQRAINILDGLASLTRKLTKLNLLMPVHDCAHARIECISSGAATVRAIDVRSVVRPFGGDGHPGGRFRRRARQAGSRRLLPERRNWCALKRCHRSWRRGNYDFRPVRTVLPSVSMDEAGRYDSLQLDGCWS